MQEEIKCPQCGGGKFNECGNNAYKCMYCGSTFNAKDSEEIKKPKMSNTTSTPSDLTVNVNLENSKYQKAQSGVGNQAIKGLAGGAGMAAGGCLTGAAIAIITPIAIFFFIIVFINSCIEGCASALIGG